MGLLDADEVTTLVEEAFFESLPRGNVADLTIEMIGDDAKRRLFQQRVRDDGHGAWGRVRVAWHMAGNAEAAASIAAGGIRCDEEHCACGRYGLGGYVALTAAKANAYADSLGKGGFRRVFLVLALPDDAPVLGEKGVRPERTATDCCSCPTEYCFVDPARLCCVCALTYRWVPTGQRRKSYAAGARVSHIVPPRRRSQPPM